jgi:hypothetical protein
MDTRLTTLQSWYQGDRAMENVDHDKVRSNRETKISYATDDPKREFVNLVIGKHIPESMGIAFDTINYRSDGREIPMPQSFETHDDILNGFRALTAPGTGFIRHLNGSEANLLYVRILDYRGEDRFFTIVINRWHDNVNSMFGESSRLDPSKDTIDFLLGSIGSYPNYFLEVDAQDLPDFFDMLRNFDRTEPYLAKIKKYGVNRADEKFWASYDRFQANFNATNPVRAGLYDLNRYYSVAIEPK